jgi:ribose transport system ATP-binding protein
MPLLFATGVSKRFGGVVALHAAEFSCEPGEIHALLGENGAGKSTMIKVLCGVQQADTGSITYDGQPASYNDPAGAASVGIIPVFQELSLVPDLTVAQNIFVGREPTSGPFLSERKLNKQTAELLTRLNIHLDPRQLVGELTVGGEPAVMLGGGAQLAELVAAHQA